MKKSLSIILSLAMVCTMSATAFAADSSTDLSAIADATIQVTQTTSESGAITNTFNNLDDFVNAVHTANPAISDYEIATYILDYTGQEYQDLPEEEILSFLTYDNISTSSSYVRVDDEGNTIVSNFDAIPLADWTSDDGYMKITTNYSYIKTVGREKYYSVWARGTWQEYPAIALQDAFDFWALLELSMTVIVNMVLFLKLSPVPAAAHKKHTKNRSVSSSNTIDEDLSFDYERFIPVMHFVPISPRCDYCTGGARDYYFSAYIRYGMIADESVNIQAGYAHKTIGFGDISVGIDVNGTPSFSASVATVVPYVARAVTVTY